MKAVGKSDGAPSFLQARGELATLIAQHDWPSTPLGPLDGWPQSLKTTVGLLVRSPVPIVLLWGADGIMIYNDAYSVFAGARHPQLLGSKVREGWPEVADFNDNVMKVGLAGGTLAYKDQELTLYRNGRPEQVWMNLDYSPVPDETGKPAGVIAIVVETTERVAADRRVADEQRRQRQLLQQMPGFVAVLRGPDHIYEYVNDAYVSIGGRTEFIGRKIRDVFPELTSQGFFELLDEVYAEGKARVVRGMELRLEGSSDAQFIDFIYEPIRNDRGEINGIFVGGYEVSEAYRANAALRASEARLKDLNLDLERQVIQRTQARGRTWQVSPDLMGALNAEGYFETSNPAWNTILGWSEEEVARTPIWSMLHPDDVERTRQGFALTQIGQPAIRFPNRYRCKDGSYRWISWVGIPEDGMVYCTGRDITVEVENEEALRKAEETIRQAQKMEAVGQLTGGLAHDFNNILAGISGSLELMQTRLAQGRIGDLDRYLTGAQGAAKRAAGLTQRLLAFSRRQTLDPKLVDLNRLVAGMQDLIARSVGPAVEVEAVAAGGLWTAFVVVGQLENALLNLCLNARDAMPDGGKLTIETANRWLDEREATARDLAPGQYLSLCVSDTGTGMPPETIARAFDPFFTTKPIGQGTGLGLSMVYGFARQSNGNVRIYSELGKGTMVCIYLPRHRGEAQPEDARSEIASAPRAAGNETVLVVDDEALVRMVATDLLTELGYAVLEASDGPSAMKILNSAQVINLLVTDVGLPNGMNGRQLADAARQNRPGLQVLFVTGYAENAVLNHGHLEPGMQVLTKPFVGETFARRVKELVSSSKKD